MKGLLEAISDGLRTAPRAQVIESGVSLQDQGFWRWWGGVGNFTGKAVNVEQALKLSTVWSCVLLIAETIASLPLGFYERKPDGSREVASAHDLYEILHNQPNAEQTAVVFWALVVASLLLWGNAFIEVMRSASGKVFALTFLRPSGISTRRLSGGGYEYHYIDPGTGRERTIRESDMMHIPGFGTDGVFGLSPIAYGANVFGTAIETDRVSAEVFGNSLKSPGVLSMDMVFSKGQRDEIRAHVKDVSEQGGVYVLEKGASFQKLGFDPVSAELLASRAWNVEEICRWYGVDPAMVGHGAKDSNWGTGLEQKMLWFITFTLRKWCVRIEQAVRKNLLTVSERRKYFAEFAIEGLLRGDSAARASFYSTMLQNGVMTRDEARQKENLAPMGGNAGVLTVQSNMLPIDKLGEQLNPARPDNGDRRRQTDQTDELESIRSLRVAIGG